MGYIMDLETDCFERRGSDIVLIYVGAPMERCMDPIYIPERPRHSGPRSIRETMRANRRRK